jgi:hypothetical protein
MFFPPPDISQLIRPETIKLNYWTPSNSSPKIASYKPCGSHNSQLRKIVLDVTLPPEFDTPLFDFSGVPEATIATAFHAEVTYKISIPVRITCACY